MVNWSLDKGVNMILLGDFNAPGIDWTERVVRHENYYIQQRGHVVLELAALLQLEQLNHSYDKDDSTKTMDLALMNITGCNIELEVEPIVEQEVFHPPFIIRVINGKVQRNCTHSQEPRYNFKQCNYLTLYNDLVNMVTVLELDREVNKITDNFYKGMYYCFNENIPKTQVILRANPRPPWITSNLSKLINRKRKCHDKYRSTGLLKWKEEYTELRKKVKDEYLMEEREYHRNLAQSMKKNPQYFWKQINNKGRKEEIILKNEAGHLIKEAEVAERFKEFFEERYTVVSSNMSKEQEMTTTEELISINGITQEEVQQSINKLKPKTAVGPDQIPAYILKGCGQVLSSTLQKIFNISLTTGEFPSIWKETYIVPIHKSGDKLDPKKTTDQ